MGREGSFKVFFKNASIFIMQWLPNNFGIFFLVSLGTMHQTKYWYCVEVGESSLTQFL